MCNNDIVRRLFNLQIAIIYHGSTVVTLTLTAPWYCVRNVMWDIHIEFDLIDILNVLKE